MINRMQTSSIILTLRIKYLHITAVILVIAVCILIPCNADRVTLKLTALVTLRHAVTSALFGCCSQLAVATSDPTETGRILFESNCASCHIGGGNLFDYSKTLKKDSLAKHGLYESTALQRIIYTGAGRMPAFGPFTSPKGNPFPAKLSESEIRSVSSFVIQQAEAGWTKNEPAMTKHIARNCDEYPGC